MPKKTMAGEVVENATNNAVEENAETVEKTPKYAVHKLREKCIHLFGVSQSTFDGAMHGHNETEYTIDEVKDILNKWLYGKRGKK